MNECDKFKNTLGITGILVFSTHWAWTFEKVTFHFLITFVCLCAYDWKYSIWNECVHRNHRSFGQCWKNCHKWLHSLSVCWNETIRFAESYEQEDWTGRANESNSMVHECRRSYWVGRLVKRNDFVGLRMFIFGGCYEWTLRGRLKAWLKACVFIHKPRRRKMTIVSFSARFSLQAS